MTFPETIIVRFDPPDLFRHDAARTFYLLWRCSHIVGQGFDGVALDIGKQIEQRPPETAFDLAEYMRIANDRGGPALGDGQLGSPEYWPEWIDAAFPYFTGQKSIGHRIETNTGARQ